MDVVRRCRPPIPPLHPRIRSFIERRSQLLFVEHGYAVPILRRGDATVAGHSLHIELVKPASGIGAQQIEEVDFNLVPLLRANPGCGLYELYAERVTHHRRIPPPKDWDGVTVFDEK